MTEVLAYALDQAPREEKIARECLARRIPLPQAIENAPELLPGLEIYWEAYADLSNCRPAGFNSVMPIPWTCVADYCLYHEFDSHQTQRLIELVRAMDSEFLRWHERKYG